MKQKNAKGFVIAGLLVLFVVYSVILMLLADLSRTPFWIGYGVTSAMTLICAIVLGFFGKNPLNAKENFFQEPLIGICFAAVIGEMLVGIVAAFLKDGTIKGLVIAEILISVLFLALIVYCLLNTGKIREMEDHKDAKVFIMRDMEIRVRSIAREAQDPEVAEKITAFADKLGLSEPMSEGRAVLLDEELARMISTLSEAVAENNMPKADTQVRLLDSKLRERNQVCRMEHGMR